MKKQTNYIRSVRAKKVVELYHSLSSDAEEIDEDIVTDLITDLLHYCRYNNIGIERTLRMALFHFHEEV